MNEQATTSTAHIITVDLDGNEKRAGDEPSAARLVCSTDRTKVSFRFLAQRAQCLGGHTWDGSNPNLLMREWPLVQSAER